jgi:hypothetical protein
MERERFLQALGQARRRRRIPELEFSATGSTIATGASAASLAGRRAPRVAGLP